MLDFGIGPEPPPTVSVYVDESKPDENCPWLVIGILILPDTLREKALENLRASRARFGYGKEIHFVEIRNHSMSPHGARTKVAIDWVRQVVYDQRKMWNLHVVAIKRSMLEHRRFGDDADDNIYARFFRSALRYGLKATASGNVVSRIFHDDSHLERHEYFSWNAIRRLAIEDRINFSCNEIEFISSDHEKLGHPVPWAAELIQLVDVWMGCFRQILAMPSTKKGRLEIAEHACGLIRILNDPKHQCRPLRSAPCKYDHRGRCSVGFFPDGEIRPSDIPKLTGPDALNYFYRGERLSYFTEVQPSLF